VQIQAESVSEQVHRKKIELMIERSLMRAREQIAISNAFNLPDGDYQEEMMKDD